MPDTTRERMAMVESQLAARGIVDTRVLEAMAWVPREDFLPEDRQSWAYRDRAVPLGHGQTVSQPYMVAAMTEALRLGPEDRVLEVGTGSGYQAAVLSAIAAEVFTIERLPDLQSAAEERLAALGISNVRFRVGDGSLGWPEEIPFDAIIVTAGAPSVPPRSQEPGERERRSTGHPRRTAAPAVPDPLHANGERVRHRAPPELRVRPPRRVRGVAERVGGRPVVWCPRSVSAIDLAALDRLAVNSALTTSMKVARLEHRCIRPCGVPPPRNTAFGRGARVAIPRRRA